MEILDVFNFASNYKSYFFFNFVDFESRCSYKIALIKKCTLYISFHFFYFLLRISTLF